MEKIYSKIQPDKLLHIIVRKEDMLKGRIDLVPPENYIQCSSLNLNKGHTFQPHFHIWKAGEEMNIAQESWHVVEGSVKCIFYDLDKKIIAEPILKRGDTSFTLEGAHNYLILEDNTLVLEYKSGPYRGINKDKVRF